MGEYRKIVLRKLQSKEIEDYLVPVWERTRLHYPRSCLEEIDRQSGKEMVGLGMKYLQKRHKRRGEREYYYRVVLCNSNLEVIYQDQFHQLQQQLYEEDPVYVKIKRDVQRLIAGKIVVGYNMGSMLRLLRIEHRNFIDIGYLYPHGLGLPCMIKLKSLAFQILNIQIEDQGYEVQYRRRTRYWGGDNDLEIDSSDIDSDRRRRRGDDSEDSDDSTKRPEEKARVISQVNVCLQLAKDYIEKGSGVFTSVTSTEKDLQDVDLMLEEAEIDKSKVVGLFLRGSRAFGVEIELDEYFSDWDYVCVIDTSATIYSSLAKLHNVDVILFDKKTFEMFISSNDLPMLELFYLPAECIIINHIASPFILLSNIKKSLAYHIKKTDVKLAHYGKQFLKPFMHPTREYSQAKQEKCGNGNHGKKQRVPHPRGRNGYEVEEINPRTKGFVHELMTHLVDSYPESKLKPQYVKWKLLKLVHLQIRMVDEYLQYKEFNCIKDIKRVTPIWEKLLTICNEKDHYSGYKFLKARLNELLQQAFSFKELFYFQFTLWVNLQRLYAEQSARRNQSYRYRRYNRGRGGRRGIRREFPQMGEATLSIYKGNVFQSSIRGRYNRIDDIDEDYRQVLKEMDRRERDNQEEPKRQIVSVPSTFGAKKALLGLAQFMEENGKIRQAKIQHYLSPYFIKTRYFFENSYIGPQLEEQANLKHEIMCLNTFRLQEHANLRNKLVQEARSAIYKTYLSVMKEQVYVKSLVCLKYLPCFEYSQHLDKEIVRQFEEEWCSVEPKLDGVSAALYYVDNGWLVASQQTPDGRDFITKNPNVTFKEEFLKIFNNFGFKLPEEDDRNKAYFFEMLSTNISNILPKEKDELILHGVRNMSNLQEESPKYYAEKYGWQFLHTEDLKISKLEQIAQLAEGRENFEGFVLKNKKFDRLIIRNSAFLKKKWEKDFERLQARPQFSFRNEKIEENKLVYFIYSEIVLKGWEEVYVKLFPQTERLVQSIISYIKQVNKEYQLLQQSIVDIKEKVKQLDDAINHKRADLIQYSFGYFNQNFPELYTSRIHTSISFDKTFNFILQRLNRLSNQ